MVSISSVPFDNRPDTILDLDPHWEKFVASIAGKRSEQEERLTHQEVGVIGDGVEEENNDVNQVDDGYETDSKDEGHDEEENSDGDEMEEEDKESDRIGMSEEADGPAGVLLERFGSDTLETYTKARESCARISLASIWLYTQRLPVFHS